MTAKGAKAALRTRLMVDFEDRTRPVAFFLEVFSSEVAKRVGEQNNEVTLFLGVCSVGY